MSRGVVYIVWGTAHDQYLERSIASLKSIHPELPYEVFRLPDDPVPYRGLLAKSRMMAMTPYDETLYLDTDTIIMDRLDYGFDKAIKFGLACAFCECPWARRYRGFGKCDDIEYNTGVLFFTRAAEGVFRRWEELAPTFDSLIWHIGSDGVRSYMPFNDQGAFAKAVAEWDRAPFVLPLNWNLRPNWNWTWFGPIKIWHDYSTPQPDTRIPWCSSIGSETGHANTLPDQLPRAIDGPLCADRLHDLKLVAPLFKRSISSFNF